MKPRFSRRTLLRGGGVALALPLLEAMLPARRAAAAPLRVAWVYVPNGIDFSGWLADDEVTPGSTLEPLAGLRADWTLLRGLTHDKARANGDGPGDHARACATFLTGVQPLKQDGRVFVGPSADQLAARALGHHTRLRSLAVGGEAAPQSGQCDSGYACAYSGNLSWSTPRTPLTKETDPRIVFERLTSDGLEGLDPAEREARLRQRRSVLDQVRREARRLAGDLGTEDRHRVDEYLTGLRELERRLGRSLEEQGGSPATQARPRRPADHVERMDLHYELLALAFQSDATRIATFLVANEGSNRSHRQVDVEEGHHSVSHHREDPEKRAALRRIDRFHVAGFARFLERLAAIEESGERLLDHCMLVYGSGIQDGNRHNHDDLPLLLAGRGGGSLSPGRVVEYPRGTPAAALHLALLERLGVEARSLGDASEPLGKLRV